jgi:hypothetical protein
MAGYYSGVLQGMKGLADIRQSDAAATYNRTMAGNAAEDQAFQRQRMPATLQSDEQALAQGDIQNKTTALELRQKELLAKKQEYEANLMKNMSRSQSQYSNPQDSAGEYKSMADMNRRMGKEMLAVDPVGAKKYFDAASTYDMQADNSVKRSLEVKAKQMDAVGNTLLGVRNQDDWNEAIQVLSQNSVAVPPQFRDWNNPATQQYIEKLAFRSPKLAEEFKIERGFLQTIGQQKMDANEQALKQEAVYDKSLAERLSMANQAAKKGTTRGSQFVRMRADQIMGAAEELSRSLSIMGEFNVDTTTGLFGEYGGNKTFLGAPMNSVARFATKEEEQQFQTTISNVGQSIAIIEAGGYKPNQAQIDNYQRKFTFGPGTTIGSRMFTIADAIAQTEARLKITLSNPDVPEEQKAVIRETMRNLYEKFPLSPEDIKRTQKLGKSYQEAFEMKKAGKLDRYLELQKKSGKTSGYTNERKVTSADTVAGTIGRPASEQEITALDENAKNIVLQRMGGF